MVGIFHGGHGVFVHGLELDVEPTGDYAAKVQQIGSIGLPSDATWRKGVDKSVAFELLRCGLYAIDGNLSGLVPVRM